MARHLGSPWKTPQPKPLSKPKSRFKPLREKKHRLDPITIEDIEQLSFINMCHFFKSDLAVLDQNNGLNYSRTTTLTYAEMNTLRALGIIRRRKGSEELTLSPFARFIIGAAPDGVPDSWIVKNNEDGLE